MFKERRGMKLFLIGPLMILVAGALMLMSEGPPNPQQIQDANTTAGVWGGQHVSMRVTAQGATLEFDCAHGTMLEPIEVNAQGKFAVRGTYTPERGGPVHRDDPSNDLPATYKGSIEGDTMWLEIVLADKGPPGLFTLTRGKAGKLVKCR
jgi:hypothetical protein